MDIELIKPQTQAKLKKPVLIGVGILVILGMGWMIFNATTTPELSTNEFYDRTSGTVVDTYTGASSNGDSTNVIYGIASIENNLPNLVYAEMENLIKQFTTYAYPNEQFSYEKDSLEENKDGVYTFKISSNKRALIIRISATNDEQKKLSWLEISSDKSVIYSYSN